MRGSKGIAALTCLSLVVTAQSLTAIPFPFTPSTILLLLASAPGIAADCSVPAAAAFRIRMLTTMEMSVTMQWMRKRVMREERRRSITSRPPNPIDRQSVLTCCCPAPATRTMDNSVIAKSGWLYKKGQCRVGGPHERGLTLSVHL